MPKYRLEKGSGINSTSDDFQKKIQPYFKEYEVENIFQIAEEINDKIVCRLEIPEYKTIKLNNNLPFKVKEWPLIFSGLPSNLEIGLIKVID